MTFEWCNLARAVHRFRPSQCLWYLIAMFGESGDAPPPGSCYCGVLGDAKCKSRGLDLAGDDCTAVNGGGWLSCTCKGFPQRWTSISRVSYVIVSVGVFIPLPPFMLDDFFEKYFSIGSFIGYDVGSDVGRDIFLRVLWF